MIDHLQSTYYGTLHSPITNSLVSMILSLPSLLWCEASFAAAGAFPHPKPLAVEALPSLEDVAVLLVPPSPFAAFTFYCPLPSASLAASRNQFRSRFRCHDRLHHPDLGCQCRLVPP